MVPWGPSPTRADPLLFGSVPLRAAQYCLPFTQANGFGWYVYPPINFMIQWDGVDYFWRPIDSPQWELLHSAQIPQLEMHYKESAHNSNSKIIPFLTSIKESNIVQIWTGLTIETKENWSVLARRPANIGKNLGYEHLEGIIQSDWWHGPLIFNISITRTNVPIVFHVNRPFLQIQAIPNISYSEETLNSFEVVETNEISDSSWKMYGCSQSVHDENKPGGYRREAKKNKHNN